MMALLKKKPKDVDVGFNKKCGQIYICLDIIGSYILSVEKY
jgi:hypothetical protein